jgi:kynurenine formamidase
MKSAGYTPRPIIVAASLFAATSAVAQTPNGVHLLEHLKLDELAAKKVYEFAFMMTPLKLEGGTGSTVAPIAIR